MPILDGKNSGLIYPLSLYINEENNSIKSQNSIKSMVKIYYGMSGALKNQTILKECPPNTKIMKSAIKPWKELENGPLHNLTIPSDLNFLSLHLIRLKDWKDLCGDNFIIERGVTDFLFFHFNSQQYHPGKTFETDLDLMFEMIRREEEVIGSSCEKILLIQRDPGFVREKVFDDPYRNATFSGDVGLYLKMQEEYIQFTKTWNKIDREVIIENAKEYIEETLKLEYQNG